jgi:bifunctional DNase/RNase
MKTRRLLGYSLGLFLAAGACARADIASPPLELHVMKVVIVPMTHSPVVILADKEEKRFLPIWIGLSEAQAIASEMEKFKPPRPMTHDLLTSLVRELDGKIEKIVITETKANTYYALMTVTGRGKTTEIDCRPSDGIAVALRAKAPIFAAETVMKNALDIPTDDEESTAGVQRLKRLPATVQTLTADLAEALETGARKGVLVTASHDPKLQRGDVILAVGAERVDSVEQLAAALDKIQPAREAELRISRDGKTSTVRVRLAGGD